jgi:hypothetical protein
MGFFCALWNALALYLQPIHLANCKRSKRLAIAIDYPGRKVTRESNFAGRKVESGERPRFTVDTGNLTSSYKLYLFGRGQGLQAHINSQGGFRNKTFLHYLKIHLSYNTGN